MQEWRNWQTRRLQVPVVARSCGFKSHLLHFFIVQKDSRVLKTLDFTGFLALSFFMQTGKSANFLLPFCFLQFR